MTPISEVPMTKRTGSPWLNYLLGLLCVGAITAAILLVGPASGSTTAVTRTAKAAEGVVQSTVSGSGNLQPASQLNLGFKTGGTVTHIYVTQGEQVAQGQLLASLDPQSAEVTLEQAKATLQSAEANLAKEEETDGEGATGSGAGNTGAASAASVGDDTASAIATAATATTSTYPNAATTAPSTTTAPASTSPAAAPTSTTPATTTPTSTSPSRSTTTPATSKEKAAERETAKTNGSEGEKTKEKEKISTATREANLASARAAVKSDTLTVHSDEQAVQDTNLYAPESGTIVSLSGQVGEVVSGSGTSKASSSSSSSGSGSSGSGASGAGTTGRSATGASSTASASSSASSSSSAFAVLSDLSSLQLVVPLSESEIGNVKVGQIATVTVEALAGSKLAAHVSEVALLATSSSGAVSYDVTFQLDQLAPGLKLGMSATAEVVVKQAEGINVPTSAITADSVTVERAGKQVRQRVVTGLAGNTSTIVLSGLKAGETVVLPAASTTSSSGASLTSRLGRLAGGGAGLGGGLGGGGGGAAFFRGGG
jgi:HlyD family secretion protein